MAKRKNTKSTKKANELPKVHKELEGFDIRINSFGEITSTFDMDKINEFLNRNVEDKKLKDRDDLPGVKKVRNRRRRSYHSTTWMWRRKKNNYRIPLDQHYALTRN